MGIVSSQIVTATPQADGTRSVLERHFDDTGRSYDFQYFAAADIDIDAVMSARAKMIGDEIASRARAEAEAANYTLPITRLAFLSRFTAAERVAIRAAAKADPVIDDFLGMINLANDISPGHPTTQAGLAYLVAAGLLTAVRAGEIGAE